MMQSTILIMLFTVVVDLHLLLNSAVYTSRHVARKQWHIIANHCTTRSTGQQVGGNPSHSPCWVALRRHSIAFASVGRNIFLACRIDLLTSRTLSNMSCKPVKALWQPVHSWKTPETPEDMMMQYYNITIRCWHQQFQAMWSKQNMGEETHNGGAENRNFVNEKCWLTDRKLKYMSMMKMKQSTLNEKA